MKKINTPGQEKFDKKCKLTNQVIWKSSGEWDNSKKPTKKEIINKRFNIFCFLFGHKMYKTNIFYNMLAGEMYEFAEEVDECIRCGDNLTKKILRKYE